jgi:ABC-2 type transport system ATP-binding protein
MTTLTGALAAGLDVPADERVIDVRDLRMRYGSKDVLDGVTFSARRGEVLALLGPNGAGKTTTIEILEGFRMRSAGEVRVLGEDPASGGERWRARLGVVLQSWRDHGKWRVHQLLNHLGMYYRDYSTTRILRRMARRESGSVVAARRERAMARVGG